MPNIAVRSPEGSVRIVPLVKARMTVGRSPRADIVLEDPFASRLHAELRLEGEVCWLHDLGSANGTRLNDSVLTNSAAPLGLGDVVRIGATRIELAPEATETIKPGGATSLLKLVQRSGDEPTSAKGLETVLATVHRATTAGDGPLDVASAGVSTLELISKVGLALLSTASLDDVLQQILDHVLERLPAERAFLFLRDGDNDAPQLKAAAWADKRRGPLPENPNISSLVFEEVLGRGRSILTSDAQLDERFRGRESVILSGVRSVMAVPLNTSGATLGMIYADSPLRVRLFDDDDLRLLTTIASVAAIKVENVLLLEERIESERLRQQAQSARTIQERLLPSRPPTVKGYDISGISFSCYEVGGDYFDFIPLEGDRLVVALGDVSGKGLDAALLMSSLHAAVRAQAESGVSMLELGSRVNRYLVRNTPANKFATLFCGCLDYTNHTLTYLNAGHNPPLLVRASGAVEELAATAPPVGMLENVRAKELTTHFEPGDVLLVYSDGLSEASNPAAEEFGAERIAAVLTKHRGQATARIRDRLDEALLQFMGNAAHADDLTLVLVRREG